jgi:hypothetical protein
VIDRCSQGYEADAVIRASRGELVDDQQVLEHAPHCAACAARLRAWTVTKRGWADIVAESPASARARDLRAARRFERAREGTRRRALTLRVVLALSVAASAAAGLALFRGAGPDRSAAIGEASAAAPAIASSSAFAGPPADVDPTPPVTTAAAARPRAVITQACLACRSTAGLIATGSPLDEAGGIDVPRGARLSLGFSVAETPGDLGADFVIEGPARAVSDGRGGIRLDRGRAKVIARGVGALTTPFGTFSGARGRWTIEVTEADARVVVEAGHIEAIATSGKTIGLGEGDRLGIDARGSFSVSSAVPETPAGHGSPHPTAPPDAPAPPVVPAPDEHWRAARHALEAGDRTLAEGEVRKVLVEVGPPHPLHGRASFFLAELLLARGATPDARSRLAALVADHDAALGEDAATLLAQSFSTRGERARVWATYLATSPPAPQRQRSIDALCREEPTDDRCISR